jgi:hypothetical protein
VLLSQVLLKGEPNLPFHVFPQNTWCSKEWMCVSWWGCGWDHTALEMRHFFEFFFIKCVQKLRSVLKHKHTPKIYLEKNLMKSDSELWCPFGLD